MNEVNEEVLSEVNEEVLSEVIEEVLSEVNEEVLSKITEIIKKRHFLSACNDEKLEYKMARRN
uniref:Uncharacterized protein n=1 Tax=Arion vulgaris TaxID=1028688 RepID=A0A0B6Z5W4_9EUPU